jgi:uncharacterized protein YeeX (DUF496 family)
MITRKQLQDQLEEKEKEIKKKDKQILLLENMIQDFKKGMDEIYFIIKKQKRQELFLKSVPEDEL